MRTLDFAPLYRSTVGFDRVASLLGDLQGASPEPQAYPPYDIEKTGEDAWRITIAVAGFSQEEISIESREGALVVSAAKARPAADQAQTVYLHRGIAKRGFERRFQLADHVKAVGASLENGLLHVELLRETPESLKPRRIQIASGAKAAAQSASAIETAQEAGAAA